MPSAHTRSKRPLCHPKLTRFGCGHLEAIAFFHYIASNISFEDIFHLACSRLRRQFGFGLSNKNEYEKKPAEWTRAIRALCSFALNQRHMFHDFVIAPMNNGRYPNAKDRNTCVFPPPSLSTSLAIQHRERV